jgi:hypothetical protein
MELNDPLSKAITSKAMSIDYTQSQTSALTGYIFNYQPESPRRVFRGELKEALAPYLPRIHASRSLGVAVLFVGSRTNYISGAS